MVNLEVLANQEHQNNSYREDIKLSGKRRDIKWKRKKKRGKNGKRRDIYHFPGKFCLIIKIKITRQDLYFPFLYKV